MPLAFDWKASSGWGLFVLAVLGATRKVIAPIIAPIAAKQVKAAIEPDLSAINERLASIDELLKDGKKDRDDYHEATTAAIRDVRERVAHIEGKLGL